MAAILEVRGLVKYFGRRKVVDGVSYEVHPGEIVGLLGPNGAGKTTSFRMTTGQLAPNEGQVFFDGVDVTNLPMYKRARLGMGYLSQEQSIFRRLTVEQNVLAILENLPRSRSLGRRLSRRERWERTDAVLHQFGLSHVRKTNSARASGGEKRRLEIARCLVCEPMMILLDEPFAAVDPLTKNDIQGIVRELARSGISILVTDHDVDQVLEIADRVYLITEGKVRCHGTPSEIVRNRVAIDSYLGERYWNRDYGHSRPAVTYYESEPPAGEVVHQVLEQEHIQRLIELLMGDEQQFREASGELAIRGEAALPALLEAMERRDMEMRRRAFAVLHHLTEGQAVFDPHAPPVLRQQQVAALREHLLLRAVV
ncbi:MAG: LPS export ABC transporter ATP-binding protein [Gemmataceae bacterium]